MRHPTASVLVLMLTLIQLGGAAEKAEQTQSRQGRITFEQFSTRQDRNGDGKVERDEFNGEPQFFQWLDQNNDGIVTAEEFRKRTQGDGRQQPADGRRVPEGVKVIRDLEYANVEGESLRLDLYLSEKSDTKPPLLVWIHGGGWTKGSKSGINPMFIQLAAEGYAAASIDYRLDGLVSHPKQIHDCKGAIRWLRANAAKYDYDVTRIGAGGGSAGGHLVLLLGLSTGVEELEGDVGGNLDQSSAVHAVVDLFGPSDLELFAETSERFRHNKTPELLESASPVTYLTKDDPPLLIIHGDKDDHVPLGQSEHIHKRYRETGLESSLHVVEGAGHGGPQFSDSARYELVKQFLDRHVKQNAAESSPSRGDELLDAVTRFADTVVEHGRDRYGKKHTPLFVDVLNVETLESPEIPLGLASVDRPGVVMSNFAYQQNLLRTLVALSNLTGNAKYRREAEKATRHVFQHQVHEESGLLYWGVHTFMDIAGDSLRHHENNYHEVKSVYPFYEFLYDVDPEKTERFIKNMWLAHVESWPVLTFNRHGAYRTYDESKAWDHAWDNPGPNVRANGLTFFNAGSDFIYAGFFLGMNADDEQAALWAGRLFERFAVGRDPTTRIMPSSSVRQSHRERGKAQFKFPNAYEPNLYVEYLPESVMARSDFAMLRTGERLSLAGYPEASPKILEPLCDHLIGYAKHAYDSQRNVFRPIINDGTDLTGYRLPNDGYYGPEGTIMEVIPAGVEYLPSYALAFRLQRDAALWESLRHLCNGNGLGDIGKQPGAQPQLDNSYAGASPLVVFTMVEIYRATHEPAYLTFAEHVCRNILRERYHPDSGLFTLDNDHIACHLDCYEPLALLTVAAAKQDKLDQIPSWDAGGRYPWNPNTILSGYSPFATKSSMRSFVLRRTEVKQ